MILNANPSSATKGPSGDATKPATTATKPAVGKIASVPSNILGAEEYRRGVAEAKAHPEDHHDHPAGRTAQHDGHGKALLLVNEWEREKAAGRYSGRIVWCMCFASFLGLQLNERFGTPAAALFLAPWVFLILFRIPRMAEFVLADWLVLLSPCFATLSALWSSEPPWSMRIGVEYMATVVVGIAAARLVDRRIVLTSMLAALVLVMIGSFAVTIKSLGIHAIHGMTGLYGSKNQFASNSALILICAVYLVIYVRATIIQKLFGFGLVGLALLGVYGGHSAGTIVSIAAVAMTAVALRIMRNYGKAAILLIMPFLFIIPFFFILADTGELFGNFLQFFGKDKTLTGRTDLWGTAFHEIGQRLLLGKGYGAFWRIGNPEAEKLWALFHIDTRVGFNFHNEYLNTAVDLGILGLLINVTLLVCVATRSFQLRLNQPETQLTAVHSMFLFFLYLTSVEQEFFYTFLLSPVILCLAWADRGTGRKPDQQVTRVVSRPPASAKTPP